MTCMSYLSLDSFLVNQNDKDIYEGTINGHFILLSYAESYWLEHVKHGVLDMSGTPSFSDLCSAITHFLEVQNNPGIRDSITKARFGTARDFIPFREGWPELLVTLSGINYFVSQSQREPSLLMGKVPFLYLIETQHFVIHPSCLTIMNV